LSAELDGTKAIAYFWEWSDKLENASKGTSTSTSCGTKIEPLRESSCAFLLEGLFASSVSGGSDLLERQKIAYYQK
jgi:hypothetical protein